MKLETKHLAPYLPYKLKCVINDKGEEKIDEMFAVYDDGTYCFANTIESSQGFKSIRPILRPMSILEGSFVIENKGITPNEVIAKRNFNYNFVANTLYELTESGTLKRYSYEEFPYWVIELLNKWHIDYMDLIGKGLAVDINTIT